MLVEASGFSEARLLGCDFLRIDKIHQFVSIHKKEQVARNYRAGNWLMDYVPLPPYLVTSETTKRQFASERKIEPVPKTNRALNKRKWRRICRYCMCEYDGFKPFNKPYAITCSRKCSVALQQEYTRLWKRLKKKRYL